LYLEGAESDSLLGAKVEETGGNTMSELNNEEINRNEYGYRYRHDDRYHTVVKGCTDSLDTDELDLYRYMIGGMQGK